MSRCVSAAAWAQPASSKRSTKPTGRERPKPRCAGAWGGSGVAAERHAVLRSRGAAVWRRAGLRSAVGYPETSRRTIVETCLGPGLDEESAQSSRRRPPNAKPPNAAPLNRQRPQTAKPHSTQAARSASASVQGPLDPSLTTVNVATGISVKQLAADSAANDTQRV